MTALFGIAFSERHFAACSIVQHSTAESNVNRFVEVKCFMEQFSFSRNPPPLPLVFLQKAGGPAWCCLPGAELSWPRSLPFPSRAGCAFGVLKLCACRIGVSSTGLRMILPAFIGFGWDSSHPTQIPKSDACPQGRGLCSGSLFSKGDDVFYRFP